MAARRDSDSSKPLHRIERDQLQLLTTIRFLAAVEVVMTHVVRGPVLSTLWLGPIIRSGDIAVIFFFALSGFIMTYVYSGSLESEATIDRRRFWSARFVRLAPAYFFALMLGLPDFVYMAFVSHILPLPTFAVGSILVPTFAQAWWPPVAVAWNAPAWSLSVEWAFYGLFPLLLATA